MSDKHDEAAQEMLREALEKSSSASVQIRNARMTIAAAEQRIASALRSDAERIAALESQTELLTRQKADAEARAEAAIAAMDRFVAACPDSSKRVADLEQALARGIARACAECDSKGRWCARCELAAGYREILSATESGRRAFEAAKEAIREEDANG